MAMNNKLFISLILCFFVTSLKAEWFEFSTTAMTTPIELVMWANNRHEALEIKRKVFREFDRIEEKMSRYKPTSELSFLNKNAHKSAIPISSELFSVLQRSKQISKLSVGAFDMTFASVGYLYDFRKKLQPNQKQLDSNLSSINYQHILLDDSIGSVRFSGSSVKVDLGGIAKGYAVDQGIKILHENGVKHARLSAGGDMHLLGDKRGKPWIVGIKDPRSDNKNDNAVVLPLSDVSISTSGDYERFFMDDDGQRVHHILSPKTGRPVEGVQSVSVIGPNTIASDGLSTAVFVLGVVEGIKLIESLEGFDVVIIDENRKMHFSEGLMNP